MVGELRRARNLSPAARAMAAIKYHFSDLSESINYRYYEGSHEDQKHDAN